VRDPFRITSLDDPRVAEYRNVRDADLRGGGGLSPAGPAGPSNKLFIAESAVVIQRLIDSGRHRIKSFFFSDEKWDELKESVSRFDPIDDTPVYAANLDLLRAISGYRHHGGALALGVRPTPAELDPAPLMAEVAARDAHCVLICEGITHVDNIGAIFRSAAALGADGILLDSACADPLFRKAIRVSMGEVFNVRWGIANDLRATIRALSDERRSTIVAADVRAGARSILDFEFPRRCAIVLGAERQGVSPETLGLARHVVEIPMARPESSLNVAVAGAIMLEEWRRQVRSRQS
jgi:tRNA G18 (ribose-2'-O)-methylase SpoU